MHRYWEALFPKDFKKLNKSKEWYQQYKDEIFFSMKTTDQMINKLCKFVKKNNQYQLWVLSSMGQAPNESKNIKSQILLKNEEKFFSNFNLSKNDLEVKPSMAPIYVFKIKNKEKINNLKEIEKILINKKVIDFKIEQNFIFLEFGHINLENNEIVYDNNVYRFEDFGLKNEPIQDSSGSSAYHDPKGILFIYPDSTNIDFEKVKKNNLIPTNKIFNLLEENFV